MLLYVIGIIIVGVIQINRGRGLLKQASQCNDAEEKAALEALGNKTRRSGQILIWATVICTVGFLMYLGV